jgi:hypothetical protein
MLYCRSRIGPEYIILIVQVPLRYRKSCLANVRCIAPGFAINRASYLTL